MQLLQTIKLILSLLPLIIETVKVIEQVMPQGSGATKLQMLRGTLEAAFEVSTDVVAKFENVWPAIEKTVSAVVTAFNASGVFKK